MMIMMFITCVSVLGFLILVIVTLYFVHRNRNFPQKVCKITELTFQISLFFAEKAAEPDLPPDS